MDEVWLKKYSMAIPTWFQGVWDTVGALDTPFGNIPILCAAEALRQIGVGS